MLSIRVSQARRSLALLFLIVFGFFNAETVIADSCDGDASPSALSVSDASSPDQSPEQGGSLPLHSVHVCHCAHAHGGSLATLSSPEESVVTPQRVSGESMRTPPSAALEQRLRPPLA